MAAGLWGLGSAILYFSEAKYKIADPKRPFPLAKHSGASENVKVYSSLKDDFKKCKTNNMIFNKYQFFTCLLFIAHFAFLKAQVPSPEAVFGFKVGADYKLADYDQMLDYYEKLDAASDRVQMIDIGKSVMGRPIKLMFISTKENLEQLERWKTISTALARAKISREEAETMVKEGKAVVWFDAGMHASERAHAQMANELAYKIATEETEEMKKIRENIITLIVPCINPDGVDIVVDWYRKNLGTPF